jgi:exodeoxyribonuclease VII large subunit
MDERAAFAAGPPVWGVGALLLAVGDALAARFGAVAVRGEISGLVRASSGHVYFALKDADGAGALLRCAMFRRSAALLDFTPADGQRVEVRGRLSIFEPRGELQMVAEAMTRVGAGTLYEEFLRLRARLEASGLFDAGRKRPLPPHPRAIGVVTSPAAAALRDVLATLARRAPHVPVIVYPTPVQGGEAPAALAAALGAASRRGEVDLLLLVRGGGSLEDLWAFNDERVVRAVVACTLPVVCGVGHETDVTLADLAADLRAPTPTAAAELAAPDRAASLRALDALAARRAQALRRLLDMQAQRLDRAGLRLQRPALLLAATASRLATLQARRAEAARRAIAARADRAAPLRQRLRRALDVRLQAQAARLVALGQRLDALDPRRVLQRGYAWIEDCDGRAVTSSGHLSVGQDLRAVWADGAVRTRVTALETAPPTG